MSTTAVDGTLDSWESIPGSWPNILLGNGFSINIWNGFSYASLYDKACNLGHLNCSAQNIFREIKDYNFEKILRILYYAQLTNGIFNEKKAQDLAKETYNNVRKALISAVTNSHVSRAKIESNNTLENLNQELSAYKKIFTTNYDLIPYWAISINDFRGFKDFFWEEGSMFSLDNVDVYGNSSLIYYLHGALHLIVDRNGECGKLEGGAVREIDNIFRLSQEGVFPLFISEGDSKNKLLKIKSNNYLNYIYDQFCNIDDSLLVLGHSLCEGVDGHIVEAIKNNNKLSRVAVGVYPQQEKKEITEFKARVNRQLGDGKEVFYFDSSTQPLTSLLLNCDVDKS